MITYDEYKKNEWPKYRPLAHMFPYDGESAVEEQYFESEKECQCKMDWLYYCIEQSDIDTVSISMDYLRKYFNELVQLLEVCLHDMNADALSSDLAFFDSFMQVGKRAGLSRAERESLDDLLIETMSKYVNCDTHGVANHAPSSFKTRFNALLNWAEFRPKYLQQNEMGVSPKEYSLARVFFYRNRDAFMQLRATDFRRMANFGNYVLWIYENCKTIDRAMIAGDIVKIHDFAVEVVRHVLVSCRANAFDEREQGILRVLERLNAETSQSPTVFISYSWSDSSVADEIQNTIGSFTIVRRDTKDLSNGDSITRFMRTIRKQDFAILVISDAYLKSRNCMYEVMQLLEDYEDSNFFNKVVLAVLSSATNLYSAKGRGNYISYWQDECNRLSAQIAGLPPEAAVSLSNELKAIRYISLEIGDFLEKVKDSKNPSEGELLEYVKHRLSGTGIIGSNVVEDVIMALHETADINHSGR